jgi:hypothetical protein
MKMRLAWFCALTMVCLGLGRPALAGTVYDNGPVNGNEDAWTINFGFIVSDTFTVSSANTSVNGVAFWAWLFPSDTLTSVEVSFTSQEFGGTTYFDQVVNMSQSNCTLNSFGFNVCMETGTFQGQNMAVGTYWMNLQNASVPNGDPVYWDENAGVGCDSPGCPSEPSENSVGTILSESFTILGNTNGTTPEPGTLLMLGTGVVGIAGVVRRKLR